MRFGAWGEHAQVQRRGDARHDDRADRTPRGPRTLPRGGRTRLLDLDRVHALALAFLRADPRLGLDARSLGRSALDRGQPSRLLAGASLDFLARLVLGALACEPLGPLAGLD